MPTPQADIYNQRLHPAVFLVPFVLLLVSGFVLLPLSTLTSFLLAGLAQALGYSAAKAKHLLLLTTLTVITLVFLSSLLLVLRGYAHHRIHISDTTLILHTGFLTLSEHTLPIANIAQVQTQHPRLGRRLNYATITLTDNTGTSYSLPFVQYPSLLLTALKTPHAPA
jgi:membrane protein YdbS with pleckstrin-like domain